MENQRRLDDDTKLTESIKLTEESDIAVPLKSEVQLLPAEVSNTSSSGDAQVDHRNSDKSIHAPAANFHIARALTLAIFAPITLAFLLNAIMPLFPEWHGETDSLVFPHMPPVMAFGLVGAFKACLGVVPALMSYLYFSTKTRKASLKREATAFALLTTAIAICIWFCAMDGLSTTVARFNILLNLERRIFPSFLWAMISLWVFRNASKFFSSTQSSVEVEYANPADWKRPVSALCVSILSAIALVFIVYGFTAAVYSFGKIDGLSVVFQEAYSGISGTLVGILFMSLSYFALLRNAQKEAIRNNARLLSFFMCVFGILILHALIIHSLSFVGLLNLVYVAYETMVPNLLFGILSVETLHRLLMKEKGEKEPFSPFEVR